MSKDTSSKSVRYVKAESVPLCLRHGYEGAALEHAQWLTVFLRDAVEALCAGIDSPDEICRGGLSLCFDLLRDKLAIASGELPFPDADILNKTDAVLWNPEQEEDE